MLIGLVTAAGFIFQMSAINIGLVPYVIAIKRTSIILGVLIGGLFFQEKEMLTQVGSTLVMLVGIFFIAFFQ